MKKFLKNISLFLTSFSFLIIGLFWFKNGSVKIDLNKNLNKIFYTKVKYFSDFIKKRNSINLVLGSSLIEDAVIPDSLGKKWFSFSNGYQNIYQSYKFIDFYKDSIKIDTILIGIQPFDFPYSYISERTGDFPAINHNMKIFGNDSINNLGRTEFKKTLQIFKKLNYLDINDLIKKVSGDFKKRKVYTHQGYSGRIYKLTNKIDLRDKTIQERNHWFFKNVRTPPNMLYFDLFQSLTESMGIKVIYLITPKSESYTIDMKITNNYETWNNILADIKSKSLDLWDYEIMSADFHYFWDEIHLSYEGAKIFTAIIRDRLYDN